MLGPIYVTSGEQAARTIERFVADFFTAGARLRARGIMVRPPESVDFELIYLNESGLNAGEVESTQETPETTDTQTQTNPAVTTTSTQARSAQQNTNLPPTVTNTYSTGGQDVQEVTREYEE